MTNTEGKVVEPPWGPLELPWLFEPTAERTRLAKKHLAHNPELEEDTRWGWFLTRGGPDWEALEHVTKRDWRSAVKCWSGDSAVELHNRATLHRILYHSPSGGEKPEAQLREALRLYHRLNQLEPSREFYSSIQRALLDPLKRAIEKSYAENDFEGISRSLAVLGQLTGPERASEFQEKMLSQEIHEFRVAAARLKKNLLPFQGSVHAPPMGHLMQYTQEVERSLLSMAKRLKHLLGEGPLCEQVSKTTAQVCAVLGQTYAKADNETALRRWLREAKSWDPEAAKEWDHYTPKAIEQEEAAPVAFPEQEVEVEVSPREWGHRLFGVKARNLDWAEEKSRETWVETLMLLGAPVFPIRRFAAYRNMDTGEIGHYTQIPLVVLDHVKQGFVVVFLTFGLLLFGVRVVPTLLSGTQTAEQKQKTQSEISVAVERLKVLAQKEAALNDDRSMAQEKRANLLKNIQTERLALIKKIGELESR